MLDHIVYTAGSTDDDLEAAFKSLRVCETIAVINASAALDVHGVTDSSKGLLDLPSKLLGGNKKNTLASLEAGVDSLKGGDN